MRSKTLLESLSKRAPAVVVATLCAAIAGYWLSAAIWLPYALATIAGSLALVLMAARNRAAHVTTEEGGSTTTSWISHELAGKGSPSGSYLLAFFGVVTIILTGLEGAYSLPAWAALALTAAWAVANARYPADEKSEL